MWGCAWGGENEMSASCDSCASFFKMRGYCRVALGWGQSGGLRAPSVMQVGMVWRSRSLRGSRPEDPRHPSPDSTPPLAPAVRAPTSGVPHESHPVHRPSGSLSPKCARSRARRQPTEVAYATTSPKARTARAFNSAPSAAVCARRHREGVREAAPGRHQGGFGAKFFI